MNKEMIIVGCSHAGGFEIQEELDSKLNRSKSFGNLLATALERTPINLSIGGASNSTIARNLIEYITSKATNESEIMVLICWTEGTRVEIPISHKKRYRSYELGNQGSDDFFLTNNKFMMLNSALKGDDVWEKFTIAQNQRFIANNHLYFEILSAQLVLMIQDFLKVRNIDYMMCNTMHVFSSNEFTNVYKQNIDVNKYYMFGKNELSFWYKYKDLGFENPNAKYWHHGEEAHRLYADELYAFYNQNYLKK